MLSKCLGLGNDGETEIHLTHLSSRMIWQTVVICPVIYLATTHPLTGKSKWLYFILW